MAEEETLTSQTTSAEKNVRDKICYPVTQPIWWIVWPFRKALSWTAGRIFGERTQGILYKKILTPANALTSVRFWLLIEAMIGFFTGATLTEQTKLLFFAIITDFFDGPTARNNNEVTELGTYMDHIGDWSVIIWVIFLNFWYLWHQTILLPFLFVSFLIITILLFINIAKFKRFCDPEIPWIKNITEFANEELQTDVWGRIQFGLLAIALFGGLFIESANNPDFIFYELLQALPAMALILVIYTCLAFYLVLGGYSIRDAIDYSETKIKKFREKLRQFKNNA
ncbi:MAG: hypothetical protein A3G49_03975 [Candidatus Sungbacteria bacterium RIFCSPLOWO2_12_FULL_41_11]|uniref:CDP-alcohol phosphatidyltransferase n=1 Tax=Candidatus Sungbacteria bacterium RIFCSPLOWO2_12_FULL_41_11 TaxID=1802286 RepID=A0A1G2LVK2_9BACT|nr:MAG: CDP-alcohol phosphatidyltransferase [Parcubacteria group bacterium GW2011_GWA2_42_14]OGZ99297.1 MAG: hypothetical protein A3D41_02445 [Candidatus Sungbacteria bacterium RIFCSPHIGHO2_02_FULL_41_12b]OHA14821.1 MAG: hypothetical protein A3G49_03975 [Candidatus Sungbacteria bacterium RIFCSPLOWO2_12_FULL_41_11]